MVKKFNTDYKTAFITLRATLLLCDLGPFIISEVKTWLMYVDSANLSTKQESVINHFSMCPLFSDIFFSHEKHFCLEK